MQNSFLFYLKQFNISVCNVTACNMQVWYNTNLAFFSVNPCELHCRPVNEYFLHKMLDAVIDGTRCYEGSQSRDMCIDGICKVS